MKYLMKFNEAIEDKGYKEINSKVDGDYFYSKRGEVEKFSDKELAAIGEIIEYRFAKFAGFKGVDQIEGKIGEFDRKIYIFKCKDEWFYVILPEYDADEHTLLSDHYECDQLEGLLKLLKDIIQQ